ncbi:MAG: hypothetical protein OHK0012_28220 [Synechococcales cyanobacterium]
MPPSLLTKPWIWWLLWLLLGVYAFVLAPADDPVATWTLVQRLMRSDLDGINPLVVAEFYLMGILPLAYACFLLPDGQGKPLPAWPFALGMMGVGMFALLPYMGLRQPSRSGSRVQSGGAALWQSPWLGRLLTGISVGVLAWGVGYGDWQDFGQLWLSNRFIHVMTLDFALLCLLLPLWVAEDRRDNGIEFQGRGGWWSWIPLLGPLVYLSIRR